VIVTAASGIKVPKPSAGIRPPPWLSGILVIRRSEDSIMVTPPSYFASGITARIQKSDAVASDWSPTPH
jgi:hypothetical protein